MDFLERAEFLHNKGVTYTTMAEKLGISLRAFAYYRESKNYPIRLNAMMEYHYNDLLATAKMPLSHISIRAKDIYAYWLLVKRLYDMFETVINKKVTSASRASLKRDIKEILLKNADEFKLPFKKKIFDIQNNFTKEDEIYLYNIDLKAKKDLALRIIYYDRLLILFLNRLYLSQAKKIFTNSHNHYFAYSIFRWLHFMAKTIKAREETYAKRGKLIVRKDNFDWLFGRNGQDRSNSTSKRITLQKDVFSDHNKTKAI